MYVSWGPFDVSLDFCSQLDMISTGCLGITGGKMSAFSSKTIVYHSAQTHNT